MLLRGRPFGRTRRSKPTWIASLVFAASRHCDTGLKPGEAIHLSTTNRLLRQAKIAFLAMTALVCFLMPIIHNPPHAHAQDVSSGLVARWLMDVESGTNVPDVSGNGKNGTLNVDASTISQSGKFGKSLYFGPATTNRMTSSAMPLGDNPFTLSAWVHARGDTSGQSIFEISSSSFFLMTLSTTYETRIGISPNVIMKYPRIPSNEWVHITVVYDKTDIHLYYNGVEKARHGWSNNLGNFDGVNVPDSQFTLGRPTTYNRNPFGAIDDVRIYNRALTDEDIALLASSFPGEMTCNADYEAVMIFNQEQSVMQYCNGTEWINTGKADNGLVAHWRMDEGSGTTLYDSSGNGNNGTMQGAMDASDDSVPGQIGTALDFDGSDDSINAGSDSSIDNIFNGGGTISAWINPTGWGEGDFGRIIDKGPGYSFFVSNYSGIPLRSIRFAQYFTSNLSAWTTPTDSITLNTWQHVAITYDNSSNANTPTIYINGVAQALAQSHAGSGTATPDNDANMYIGNNGASDRAFEGSIDDVRIYNRALSADEVTGLYTNNKLATTCTAPDGVAGEMDYNYTEGVLQYCNGSKWVAMGPKLASAGTEADITYTAPTANLVGHWTLDDINTTALDSAGSNNGTMEGGLDGSNDSVPGKIGNALNFDGSDDYVESDTPSSTSETYSLWINPTSHALGDPDWANTLMTRGHNDQEGYFGMHLGFDHKIGVATNMSDGNTYRESCTGNTDIPLNTWTHVSASRDASNKVVKIYLNGVLDKSCTMSHAFTSSVQSLFIGRHPYPGFEYFYEGIIDDVRIYNAALSDSEIYALYRATGGTGGPDPSLVGHWKLDETTGTDAIDSSGNGNDGTMEGSMDAEDDSVPGKSGTALDFDGTDDYIKTNTAIFNPSTTNFTASLWVRPTALDLDAGADRAILTQNNGTGTGRGWLYIDAGNQKLASFIGGGGKDSGHTLQINNWIHITLVYDVSTDSITWYINGVQGPTNTSVGMETATGELYIGSGKAGQQNFKGKIDDVRIYNRALSAAEIASLYGNTGGGKIADCSGLGDAQYTDPNTGHCYYRVDTAANWATAQANCQAEGGYLATISSADENSKIWNNIGAWWTSIGGTDSAVEGEWRWVNGETDGQLFFQGSSYGSGSTVSGVYSNFNPSGLNNSGNCVQMYSGGSWDDFGCTSTKYICEKTPAPAGGSCLSPDGVAGEIVYNDTHNIMQYCNGSAWVGIGQTGTSSGGSGGGGGGDTTSPAWSTSAGTIASVNINGALSTTVTATDETSAVSYSKQSGDAWLNVNATTGEITGTAPSTGGTSSITVRAEDASGNYTDRTFDIDVIILESFESWSSGNDQSPDGWTRTGDSNDTFGLTLERSDASDSTYQGTAYDDGNAGIKLRINASDGVTKTITLSKSFDLTNLNTLEFNRTGTHCPCDGDYPTMEIKVNGTTIYGPTSVFPNTISADISAYSGSNTIKLVFNVTTFAWDNYSTTYFDSLKLTP